MFPSCHKKNRTLKFFLKNTSLHGMKYVGDEKKHWCERFFWFILLLIFAVFSFKTLTARWISWKASPMEITTVNVPYSISSLPVPAITYCRDYLVSSEVTNIANLSSEYQSILCSMMDVIDDNLKPSECYSNKISRYEDDIDDESFFKKFDELIITDKKYLNNKSTSFMPGQRFDEPISCYDMLTSRGLCFTCNSLPPSQIYKNNTILHYFHNNPDDYDVVGQVNGFPVLNSSKFNLSYPSRVRRPMNGVTMNDFRNLENESVEIFHRFNRWYTIHSPWDVPNPFMRWHYSKHFRNRELQVFIEPDQTLIDDNLKISPLGSECYSAYGKELEFFKYYTHQNCKMECLTREVLNECGCVMYYMPHNESTKICLKDVECPNRIIDQVNVQKSLSCDCLASCNHTDYRFVSHDSIPGRDSSKLITVFIDDIFYPQIRGESGTIENFIETSVTYLDMFLGLSLISIVEVLYYTILMLLECFNVEQVVPED